MALRQIQQALWFRVKLQTYELRQPKPLNRLARLFASHRQTKAAQTTAVPQLFHLLYN
ncbi:hypothetical protein N836_27720 [Leptolyngbya sp. Heron Island J]|nr:hypothetical protein N836_27720 [Leptolyngbya sp. Heron Island J]